MKRGILRLTVMLPRQTQFLVCSERRKACKTDFLQETVRLPSPFILCSVSKHTVKYATIMVVCLTYIYHLCIDLFLSRSNKSRDLISTAVRAVSD